MGVGNAKGQSAGNNRIKHALHLPGWIFGTHGEPKLRQSGRPVMVTEYQPEMKGALFCPECCCPLFRSPENDEANKAGRNAYFAHKRNTKTECSLRTKQAVGKKYLTEEEAAQAIVDGKLVVVHGFLKDRPVSPDKNPGEYDQTAVEDEQGQVSEVAIARHRGKTFNLPGTLTTVRGLCRRFDENLYKYYAFPGTQYAQLLADAIRDVDTLESTTELPVLGYGRIVHIFEPGKYPSSTRFVKLAYKAKNGFGDFSIMLTQEEADLHELTVDSVGRFAMFYGKISINGSGLSAKGLGWGEVTLVPSKYDKYLGA